MKKARTSDSRLARVANICVSLPDAVQERAAQHATFLVHKSTFAYYLNDHHGDGIISVCCKVLPGDNEVLVAAQPSKFYLPAYIGPRGWVGLRLDVAGVDWNEVAELVVGSYRMVAPKRLAQIANLELAKGAAAARPRTSTAARNHPRRKPAASPKPSR
jgi:hypothetical protein